MKMKNTFMQYNLILSQNEVQIQEGIRLFFTNFYLSNLLKTTKILKRGVKLLTMNGL